MTSTIRPGEWVDTAARLEDIAAGTYEMQIRTDRYTSPEFQERERETIWMRVWQVAGRNDELPNVGDWKVYQIFDQSYIIVRGKDGQLRGFVNACRHRGNTLCTGTGNAKRGFVCQYHLWSYDLEGRLRGILREEFAGEIDKSENSLLQVPVETFAGFIFINPDPNAAPLAEFIGDEVADLLAPYHLDEMVPVMNVREPLECNWKVVMDAFEEGYHIDGIHPQLLRVIRSTRPPSDTVSSPITASRWLASKCWVPARKNKSRESWSFPRHCPERPRCCLVSRSSSAVIAPQTGLWISPTASALARCCGRAPETP